MDLYIIPQIKEIMGFYSHPKSLNQNRITKKEKEENAGLIAF
jgi:hypothetical protein